MNFVDFLPDLSLDVLFDLLFDPKVLLSPISQRVMFDPLFDLLLDVLFDLSSSVKASRTCLSVSWVALRICATEVSVTPLSLCLTRYI